MAPSREHLDQLPANARSQLLATVASFLPYYCEPRVRCRLGPTRAGLPAFIACAAPKSGASTAQTLLPLAAAGAGGAPCGDAVPPAHAAGRGAQGGRGLGLHRGGDHRYTARDQGGQRAGGFGGFGGLARGEGRQAAAARRPVLRRPLGRLLPATCRLPPAPVQPGQQRRLPCDLLGAPPPQPAPPPRRRWSAAWCATCWPSRGWLARSRYAR
jgi:hypothetical protein